MVVSAFRRLLVVPIIIGVLAAITLAATADPAEARKRRGGYAPPYASIVVDVNTGRVLQAANPDAPRFPASVTKVMTLYLLFEQIERGKLRLDSALPVSSFAARQAPSKIGFDPGETIEVEEAIKALVTKSANDVAVVVAEAIGGDQDTFAAMMTRKARALGMSNTTFRNASGLPDPQQVTTARDLTILGRSIHDHFPKYWRYFQTRSFKYAGRSYRNHNRLLGRIEGVDGIKTGYTRASGFNLLTSARYGNRHVMAVVLGGRSGGIRDAQMAALVERHIESASAGGRTAPVIAQARPEEPVRVASAATTVPAAPAPAPVAAAPRQEPTPAQRAEARLSATREAEPAKSAAADTDRRQLDADVRRAIAAAPAAPVQVQPTRTVAATVVAAAPTPPRPAPAAAAYAPQPAAQPGPQLRWTTGAQPTVPAKAATGRQAAVATAQPEPATTGSANRNAVNRSGFVIQLGASGSEGKARAILDQAKAKNRTILAEADGFTEKVQKGDSTLFRARFGGFDDTKEASAACGALKRSGFSCFVQRI
ncbi:MAG: D-alanyl-D-alanine carboxypeptidase [Methylocystis sp.]|nr:D-alanyl-D-alanine carboxypeptidase [Methylocystis sp.]MCA3584789.1 D-alanyl-D-alanine carboxypeptidase [Methylocystis sp.]MCA3589270.1 D-alanyl-D-alanine carboxypeptidase [Methylocystis sp.]MCA3593226.1 D-alanyl-D-alanine carboxypeptidase [Methylocystis sp.]